MIITRQKETETENIPAYVIAWLRNMALPVGGILNSRKTFFFSKTKTETGKRVFPLEIFRSHRNKKWLRLTNKVIITLSGKISVYYTFMMTMHDFIE